VLDETYVLGVGYTLLAWTSMPLPAESLRPLCISGHVPERIEELVRHEVGHAWVAPFDVGPVRALPVAEYEASVAAARVEGWPVEAAARRGAEEEDLVTLLAAGWGLA
jgi:hypothetical protein